MVLPYVNEYLPFVGFLPTNILHIQYYKIQLNLITYLICILTQFESTPV